MKFVLDASMALAWLFEREKTNEADCADRALLAMEHAEALVPQLWHIDSNSISSVKPRWLPRSLLAVLFALSSSFTRCRLI